MRHEKIQLSTTPLSVSSKIMETSGNRETAWRKYARGWIVRSGLRGQREMAKLTRGSGRREWP